LGLSRKACKNKVYTGFAIGIEKNKRSIRKTKTKQKNKNYQLYSNKKF
jgi:hypothetical protein